jgi:hypothetical protein
MKKLIIILVCVFIFPNINLRAIDISLGLKNWAAWNNEFAGFYGGGADSYIISDKKETSKINPLPEWNINPSLNIRLDKENSIAINSIVSMNEMTTHASNLLSGQNNLFYHSATNEINGITNSKSITDSEVNYQYPVSDVKYKFTKYDSDILYTRRLNNNFSMYGGLKYLYIKSDTVYSGIDDYIEGKIDGVDAVIVEDINQGEITPEPMYKFIQNSVGPGFGIGYNTNITGLFFFLAGISETFLYSWNDFEWENFLVESEKEKVSGNYIIPTTNTKLSGAYYFADIKSTLEFGLQAQYFYYIGDSSNSSNANILDGESLFVFGPIVTFVYTF